MHVYKWTHKESGMAYVGQSVQEPRRRAYEHINGGNLLHSALLEHGRDAFDYEILYWAEDLDDLNNSEQRLIAEHNTITPNGYNVREGGGNSGRHHPDSIEKMRESQRKAHARRRANGGNGGWQRKDGGPMLGKTQSKYQKSIATKSFSKQLTCPHCGFTGRAGNVTRWHMDNCKEKSSAMVLR